MADLKDIMRLADLKPSHEPSHLKQVIPEEAKRLLYQQEVDSVEHALVILRELYEPLKDSSPLIEEILRISQQLNKRLKDLARRIEDAAHNYSETLELPSTDLAKSIKSRFKHAIMDQETRNQLLWDWTEMTLDQMVRTAQQFEDFRSNEPVNSPKSWG